MISSLREAINIGSCSRCNDHGVGSVPRVYMALPRHVQRRLAHFYTCDLAHPGPVRTVSSWGAEPSPVIQGGRLQRMINLGSGNKVSLPSSTIVRLLRKGATDPWEQYQKLFKTERAGDAIAVYEKNDEFELGFIRQIEADSIEWLSSLITGILCISGKLFFTMASFFAFTRRWI
jgi:hypothetical protein